MVIAITINYNHHEETISCVNSVLGSVYANFKIIVVDNGSVKDDYYSLKDAFVNENKVKIVRIDKNCGYVGGINFGLEFASQMQPNYYLILNNDTIIDKNAIEEFVTCSIKHRNNAIISGKVYHYNDPKRLQNIGGKLINTKYLLIDYYGQNTLDIGQYDTERSMDMLDDVFWLVPNDIYSTLGGYSNYFYLYAEQADYAQRAIANGFELIYTPKAKIWHKGSTTTGEGERYAPHVNYWRKKGTIIYRALHLKRTYYWIYSLRLLFKLILKMCFTVFGKNKLSTKSQYAGIIGVLHGMLWNLNRKENAGYNPFLNT